MAWSLGANAWGTTFVIGAGTRFPQCPQHQVANLVGSLDGTGDVLLGGAVDGPSDYIPTGFFGPSQAPPCPADKKNPFRPFDQPDWRYDSLRRKGYGHLQQPGAEKITQSHTDRLPGPLFFP